MPAKRFIVYVALGLMSFILTIVFLLGQIDPAVADRNPILYDKAQQAQSKFLTKLMGLKPRTFRAALIVDVLL